jgi:hypothetical protein
MPPSLEHEVNSNLHILPYYVLRKSSNGQINCPYN